ncbi:late embryogenesis abundant protein D-34-like [Diospyros lotus]|uniref:late embryogenesis abundant protein D-34-like n=1 Tax=Diospyros lotus TaxID=55363 RepID=UPI0022571549|nr:late embryogenesis abundant protein D-34-like [Diospyros lotus]
MSKEQPRRPQPESVKYGDVFEVSGDLANKPIAPQDAAMMQSAETRVIGRTQKGGPAAVMESAAMVNERAGVVGHGDVTDVAGDRGVAVTATNYPGARIVTEAVAGQVVGRNYQPTPVQKNPAAASVEAQMTIGEALEAAAYTAGDRPVDQSDAAAIQAAEVRATGTNVITPGGVAALAQSAASINASLNREEDKIKLTDVLRGAIERLPADKAATREDAEGVVSAEVRNKPDLTTRPGGVAASVAAAARLNKGGAI